MPETITRRPERTSDIVNQLKVWRLAAKKSKAEMARALGVPVTQISIWESSSDGSLTLRTLRQYARATGTEVSLVCNGALMPL
jgi:transcriptional regulator with XRE-family HTH domain